MFPSQTGVIPPLVNTVFIYISKQHSTIDANMQSWKGSCGEPDIHITHVLEVPNPSLLQELDTVKQQVSSQDTSSYVSFKKPKQFLCPLCNSDGSEDNQEIHLKVLLISNFCLFKLRTFSTVCELKRELPLHLSQMTNTFLSTYMKMHPTALTKKETMSSQANMNWKWRKVLYFFSKYIDLWKSPSIKSNSDQQINVIPPNYKFMQRNYESIDVSCIFTLNTLK